MSKMLAIALEAVGVSVIVMGICIEAAYEADAGFMAITGGAGMIAVGSLLWAKIIGGLKK